MIRALSSLVFLAVCIHSSPVGPNTGEEAVSLIEHTPVINQINFGTLLEPEHLNAMGKESVEGKESVLEKSEPQEDFLSQFMKSTTDTNEKEAIVKQHREQFAIFGADQWKDAASQAILNHLATSSKFAELGAVTGYKEAKAVVEDPTSAALNEKIFDSLRGTEAESAFNTVVLLIADAKFKNKGVIAAADIDKLAQTIVKKVIGDAGKSSVVYKKFSDCMDAGRDALLMDNEEDDLTYLWMRYHDGKIPRIIIPYGGFSELRLQSLTDYVNALNTFYKIPEDSKPRLYEGFPHFQDPKKKRPLFDYTEASGYIPDSEITRMIDNSAKVEDDLRKPALATWEEPEKSSEWWKHKKFLPGIEALGELIDSQEYTAVNALTSPSALYYAIIMKPERRHKVGLALSSGFSWDVKGGEVQFDAGFNGARRLPITNELLNMGIDFVTLGGGLSKTKGARTITDAKVGKGGQGFYSDPGFEHYDSVVNVNSPVKFLEILALSGNSLTLTKWLDWDVKFDQLFKYLEIPAPARPQLEQLRNIPSGRIGDMLKAEMKKTRPLRKGQVPEAAKWGADRLITLMKVWLLSGHMIARQMNPADLHPLMLMRENLAGINGGVRLTSEEAAKVPDRNYPDVLRTALRKLSPAYDDAPETVPAPVTEEAESPAHGGALETIPAPGSPKAEGHPVAETQEPPPSPVIAVTDINFNRIRDELQSMFDFMHSGQPVENLAKNKKPVNPLVPASPAREHVQPEGDDVPSSKRVRLV